MAIEVDKPDFEGICPLCGSAGKTYKIIRFYFEDRPRRTIKRGLSLEQAIAHCSDPETSSRTCTRPVAASRTRRLGPWFDTYNLEA